MKLLNSTDYKQNVKYMKEYIVVYGIKNCTDQGLLRGVESQLRLVLVLTESWTCCSVYAHPFCYTTSILVVGAPALLPIVLEFVTDRRALVGSSVICRLSGP